MNKKILIVIMLAVIIITSIVLFIVFTKNNESKENNIDIDRNNIQQEIVEEKEENKKTFWINSVKFPEKKSNPILTLFNDKISLPVKLDELDVCSAPYHFFPNGINRNQC